MTLDREVKLATAVYRLYFCELCYLRENYFDFGNHIINEIVQVSPNANH